MLASISSRAAIVFVAALALTANSSDGATIRVPADQPTIAAALAVAVPGDEIVIARGTYGEHGLVLKPGITIRGETGLAGDVVIDGQNAQRVLAGSAVHGLTLQDFTVTRGNLRHGSAGGGVYLYASQGVTIRGCRFESNRATTGGGVYSSQTDLAVIDCSFQGNRGREGTAVAALASGSLSITGSSFAFNGTADGYGFATLNTSIPTTVTSSNFSRNAGVVWSTSSLSVTDCRFHANHEGWTRSFPAPCLFYFNGHGSAVTFERCVFDSDGWAGGPWPLIWVFVSFSGPFTLESCTFHNERASNAFFWHEGTDVDARRTVFSSLAVPTFADCNVAGGGVTLECCDLWAFSGTFSGSGCAPPETTGVLLADPRFCNPVSGDFRLAGDSPCLPPGSPCGQLIGALGVGCGAISVEPLSWGRIKNLYR